MKMKVSKVPFFIPFAIALAFVALAVVFFIVPEKTPVVMSEKIEIRQEGENFVWRGKIKNVTSERVDVYYFSVTLHTVDSYQEKYGSLVCGIWFEDRDFISLQPNEEFDLSRVEFNGGVRVPDRVEKVSLTVDGVSYILPVTFSQGNNFVLAMFMLVFAVVFGVFSVATYNGINRQKRRIKYAESIADTVNGTYLTGFYGKKGDGKKAAVKTAASVAGAVFSSLFLGVGVYKIFTGASRHEFILTEDGMYVFGPADDKIDLSRTYHIEKGKLPQSQVSEGKRQVVLTCGSGGGFFSFEIKNGGKTSGEVVDMLTKLFVSDGDVMRRM